MPVTEVSEPVLQALGETVTPQGLVGVAPLLAVGLDAACPRGPRLVAVLDAVNDPGNAGTVLRTADAAGADAVVLTAGSTDPHGGKCVRASAGSLWHLPVVAEVPRSRRAGRAARSAACRCWPRAAPARTTWTTSPTTARSTAPTAWLFGTEAHGLPPDLLGAADRRVRIPLRGRAESLNLAAAAAVCLYASARAQRERP